jgi:hypothetical protein
MARALPAGPSAAWPLALAALMGGCGGGAPARAAAPAATAAPDRPPDDFLIRPGRAVGRIDADTTRETLPGIFPGATLRDDTCGAGEGEEIPCTRVSLDGQESALVVYWKARGGRADVVDVYSDRFHTAEGLELGLTLPELVARNDGVEVHFYGFDWDYGGTVSKLGGGPLDQPGLEIRLSYPSGTDPAVVAPLQSDREFRSTDPRAAALRILVDRIRIRLAPDE